MPLTPARVQGWIDDLESEAPDLPNENAKGVLIAQMAQLARVQDHCASMLARIRERYAELDVADGGSPP